jgi:glycosyltransferase involved in cell wall biosynthesis
MKQTADQIKSFEIAKKEIPELQIKIGGDSSNSYGKQILKIIESSMYRNDIEYVGKVSQEIKKELMQKSSIILSTSIKEGWGLIVSEASSQGTLAIVYNSDGLKSSVKHNETGIITKERTPESMAKEIIRVYKDQKLYKILQENGLQWSKELTFEKSYTVFKKIINA